MESQRVYTCTISDRPLTIETGLLAEQADGAVTVRYGDTVVLVTVCVSPQAREGVDFLPLTVDYEERLYAAGKIPGSWFRREGRPSQEAILAARLTDRAIRPLFPKGFRQEIQVVATPLSADQENDPAILALVGASAALTISSIPFNGPVAAVRVGYVDGKLVANPSFQQLERSQLDLVVAGTRGAVVMVEAGAREAPEDLVLDAIRFGHDAMQPIIEVQERMAQEVGKPKLSFTPPERDPELMERLQVALNGRMETVLLIRDRTERQHQMEALKEEVFAPLAEEYPRSLLEAAWEEEEKRVMRTLILTRGVRVGGRGLKEIRPIWTRVGVLPRTHGSGLFTRGQTQVLSIVTLGSLAQEQILDTISPEERKRFIHHYNFPPYSTGEVRRMGGPSRRDIGHGALVERALEPVIPSEEEFPYTIRIVSEVLSSNGSTSMGSVCGSTLALMDAGVPIKAPVSGVAMGLIVGEDGRFAILTDIEGVEDFLGDMDFKVPGTAKGITALQMDVKVSGLSYEILEAALAQAKEARLFILEKMLETIPASRASLSPYAPRMHRIHINPDKIRIVIGPGGRTIRSLMEEYKVTIDVENDGTVIIGSPSEEAAQRAAKAIEQLTKDVQVGEIYTGRVTRLMSAGAFVEVLPGQEGLVRTEDLADYPVRRPEDVVKVGDEITVMVVEIDRQGRVNLSRRAALMGRLPTAEERAEAQRARQGPRRGGDGGPPRGAMRRGPGGPRPRGGQGQR